MNQPEILGNIPYFSIQLHIVFVTRYRRQVLDPEVLQSLKKALEVIFAKWDCSMVWFEGNPESVQFRILVHPNLKLSVLVNNLKSSSSRRIRKLYSEHLDRFYRKPHLWGRSYFVASVGLIDQEIVRGFMERQGTTERIKPEGKDSGEDPPVG